MLYLCKECYCHYQFNITDAAPGVTLGEVMDFDIVDFPSPNPEEEIQPYKT